MKFEAFETVSARRFYGACIKRLNSCGWTTITKLQCICLIVTPYLILRYRSIPVTPFYT